MRSRFVTADLDDGSLTGSSVGSALRPLSVTSRSSLLSIVERLDQRRAISVPSDYTRVPASSLSWRMVTDEREAQ